MLCYGDDNSVPVQVMHPKLNCCCVSRAEPLLARINEDRTVILTPVFDNVGFDDLILIPYIPAADAFDWALWCMYESFRPEWYALKDESQPGK